MASKQDLERALAGDKNLRRADLSGANLGGAVLGGADLNDANLRGANLRGSDLRGAYLWGAELTRATLARANLSGADLSYAGLSGANLSYADLTNANFFRADLSGADLSEATLTRADLTRADLTNADLTRAALYLADLTRAKLTGAVGYAPPVLARRRTSGRATGAALKLGAADVPVDPRDFKRRFPREFDLLARRGLAGRPFRPEAVVAIQKQLASPVEWVVTQQEYKSTAQRYCATPNDVLLLNIDLSDSSLTKGQREALRKLAEVSRQSGHPHEKGDLFTIGWVRYCAGDGAWLIEEVQSDVQVARTGLKDPETRTKLADAGIDAESFEEAIAAIAPYTEAFYHDAIGLVFEMARAAGVEVEMLEYGFKVKDGATRRFWPLECPRKDGREVPCHPPKDIYTDLPREMGMVTRAGSRTLPDISGAQVWAYRPNPTRKKRRSR